MNIKKITTYLLKLLRSGERVLKAKYKDGYLITDGYKMFYLKENELEINPNLIKDNKGIVEIWEKATKNCYKLGYELSKKNNIYLVDKYSNKEQKLDIYIDEKMFNFFDLYSVELYGSDSVSPVAIRKGEEFIAIVLPLRMIAKF
jgi:hypothetical protein